jgi:2-C-methyl-D-erythritol 2,4-cyclodiphosphate synthase
MLTIGLGRDLHRLKEGRRFILGGVVIPFEKGELGHSDGDVLTHAVIDALLGAASLGDIGEFFPPHDPRWKDASSLAMLGIVREKIHGQGWRIVHIDSVISCERPKILPYRGQICASLAKTLEIDAGQIFVKSKTGEGLGSIGRGRAVEALAVCLLEKPEQQRLLQNSSFATNRRFAATS